MVNLDKYSLFVSKTESLSSGIKKDASDTDKDRRSFLRKAFILFSAFFSYRSTLPKKRNAMAHSSGSDSSKSKRISLPFPEINGNVSLETALKNRRSKRRFEPSSLSVEILGQLLWAAQGITSSKGYRTAPSAGALYPLEIDVVVSRVEALRPGIYRYLPHSHELVLKTNGYFQAALSEAALGQKSVRNAPAVLAICAVYARTMKKYGKRGKRYVHMEAGHAAENVYLQATGLDVNTVAIGAFHDTEVMKTLKLDPEERPLYLMPIGK